MDTVRAMFKSKVTSLPGHIQSVYVQNITKLYASILVKAEIAGDQSLVREVGQLLLDNLPMFVQSSDLEVQERVCVTIHHLFSSINHLYSFYYLYSLSFGNRALRVTLACCNYFLYLLYSFV